MKHPPPPPPPPSAHTSFVSSSGCEAGGYAEETRCVESSKEDGFVAVYCVLRSIFFGDDKDPHDSCHVSVFWKVDS